MTTAQLTLAGSFYANTSWAIYARSLAAALHRRCPLALASWDAVEPLDPETGCPELLADSLALNPAAPLLAIGATERLKDLPAVGSPRCALLFWETSRITERARAELAASIDQLWVPSLWGYEVALASGWPSDRLRMVAGGVDTQTFTPAPNPGKAERPFRFLCVGKWERRKGVAETILAYLRAFTKRDGVELVMHCHHPHIPHFDLAREIARVVAHFGYSLDQIPPIRASLPVTRAQLVRLLHSVDAFVLLTRGEGWGMPILEAMACGLPCIVTQYSALLMYAHLGNACLIPVEKFEPARDRTTLDPSLDWGWWACPSIEAAVVQLRFIYGNPVAAQAIGQRARQDVEKFWSWSQAAERVCQTLSSG